MTELARRALTGIPDEKAADLVGRLPSQGLQPGSACLFRGPVGLQAFYTFGEGDILDQRGLLFGVAGSYEDPKSGHFILILIDYPDAGRAQAAYQKLAGRLDPYLKILIKQPGEVSSSRIFRRSSGSSHSGTPASSSESGLLRNRPYFLCLSVPLPLSGSRPGRPQG